MICQALWDIDSPLMQLPHMNRDIIKQLNNSGIEGIFDLIEM